MKRRGEGLCAHTLREDPGEDSQQPQEVGSFAFMLRALLMARSHWRLLLLGVCCLVATASASIALPSFQGQILDHVVQGNKNAFQKSVKIFVAVFVALGLFGCVRNLAFSLVGARIASELRVQLFGVIMCQSVDFFDAASSGELHQRLGWDTTNTSTPIQSALSSALNNMLLLLGGCAMCVATSWRLSVLAFCALYPISVITREYAIWSSIINRDILSSYGEATNVAGQAIGNIRTVRAFGTAEMETEQYDAYVHEGLAKSVKDAYAGGASYALTNYLDLATSVLLLWYGGSVVLDADSSATELTIGKLITFQLYWNLMSGSYSSLQDLLTVFTRSSGSAQRVFTLLDNLPKADPTAGVRVESVQGDITLEDVSFSYALRPENPVLQKVNLQIKRGTVTALVGRSGGGKSTIVSLLMRLYEPSSGRILLDGRDIKHMHVASLFRHFAVVQQATELFGGSILQNLTYGLKPEEEWSMSSVHSACIQANCLDFILGFEEGFATRVGERGVRLSGGQRQRLSIARAMLRQASVLLLDEAKQS